jgi:large subunit ribosomal protein L31e
MIYPSNLRPTLNDPTTERSDHTRAQNANTSPQGTKDVRIDPQLNKTVWEGGVKGVPYRLRVRISRRRNDEEGAKEKLYSYVQAVNVKNPKGLHTVVVEE